jgi:hypothetical protein
MLHTTVLCCDYKLSFRTAAMQQGHLRGVPCSQCKHSSLQVYKHSSLQAFKSTASLLFPQMQLVALLTLLYVPGWLCRALCRYAPPGNSGSASSFLANVKPFEAPKLISSASLLGGW